MEVVDGHETAPISWRCSSTPIVCTASGSLNMQWKASTADPLFKALQAVSTAVPARGIKRAVLQDWNSADSPSLKRPRFEGCGMWAPPALLHDQHPSSLSKRGPQLSRDDEGARKGMRLSSPPSRLHHLQDGTQPLQRVRPGDGM